MRKLILALVLAAATVGVLGVAPSKAQAWWGWRRGYSAYYYPAYYSSYSYYYAPPAYSYYPAYTSYYYPSYSSYYYPATRAITTPRCTAAITRIRHTTTRRLTAATITRRGINAG